MDHLPQGLWGQTSTEFFTQAQALDVKLGVALPMSWGGSCLCNIRRGSIGGDLMGEAPGSAQPLPHGLLCPGEILRSAATDKPRASHLASCPD